MTSIEQNAEQNVESLNAAILHTICNVFKQFVTSLFGAWRHDQLGGLVVKMQSYLLH